MIIKMAVKDTPAILGTKLKQYYHKVTLLNRSLRCILVKYTFEKH